MADLIDQLAAMDDKALSAKVGLDKKLEEARKGIAEMQALTGLARKEALERVTRMFQPNVYPEEFKWIAKDAERHAKKKTAVEEMCDCDPASLLD